MKKGKLRLQVVSIGGVVAWAETSFKIPLKTWSRFILSANENRVKIITNYIFV